MSEDHVANAERYADEAKRYARRSQILSKVAIGFAVLAVACNLGAAVMSALSLEPKEKVAVMADKEKAQ